MFGNGLSNGLSFSYSCFTFTLIILVLGPCTTNTQNTKTLNPSLLQFEKETSKFIVENIISRHLSSCSTIILAELGTGYINRDTYSADMTTSILHLNHLNLASPTTLLFSFKEPMKERKVLLRYGPAVKLVISVVSTVTPQFSSSIDHVISADQEFSRRDEDYYIFVSRSEQVGRTLLVSQITNQMRYKIVAYPNSINLLKFMENNTPYERVVLLTIKTVCLYWTPDSHKILDVPEKLDSLSLSQIFPDTTRNLQKHTVKVSAPTGYLATYEMEKVNGEYRHKRGIHTLIFNIIGKKINITYSLQPCTKFGKIPKGATGVLLENGTWAGCMGDVIRGISDMALSTSPDYKRFESVHFSSALEYTFITYATSKPKLFYSWRSIFTAFDIASWAILILSIFVAACSIHFMDQYLEPFEISVSINFSMLTETGLYLFGYIVGQDVPCPKSFPSKCSYVAWLLYGLVIGAIYVCSLQALIVSPGFENVPETFSELVNSNYKWGAAMGFRSGLGEQLFRNSNNPIMRTIYHSMQGDPNEIACTRKAVSNYACFNWEMMQQFRFQTEFADRTGNHPFQMAKEIFFFTSLNFVSRKRELFRSQFNEFISRSFDTGFAMQTIKMDWRKYRLGVVKARREGKMVKFAQPIIQDGPIAFRFDNVKGCFWVLLCGLVTSVIAVILEKAFSIYVMHIKGTNQLEMAFHESL